MSAALLLRVGGYGRGVYCHAPLVPAAQVGLETWRLVSLPFPIHLSVSENVGTPTNVGFPLVLEGIGNH